MDAHKTATATWPLDTESTVVATALGPIRLVHLAGAALPGVPPVLFVHGFHGSTAEWGTLATALRSARDVWAVELRGHECVGGSPDGPTVGTTEDQLDVISQAVDAIGVSEVEIIGSSYGGYLTALWSTMNQSRLHRLTLLGPGLVPLHWSWPIWPVRALLRSPRVLEKEEGRRDLQLRQRTTDTFMDEATPYVGNIPEPVREELLATYLVRADDPHDAVRRKQRSRSLAGLVGDVCETKVYQRKLASLARPVLWLHGVADPLVPFERIRPLADKLPDWKFVAMDGVGHVPALEAADRTAAEILA